MVAGYALAMCANCVNTADVLAAQAMLAAALLKAPVHRALASIGAVVEPHEIARDARTVSFLRSLELDPDAMLGADVVGNADRWVATGGYEALEARRLARKRSWARPIGSHRRLAPQ